MALEPITRQEKIIAGQDLTPITRLEKFLKDFGVQPNWNQNDSTAPDYVKNRPFYTVYEETVLFDESTVSSFSDMGSGIYTTMLEVPSLLAVGNIYKVSWDGSVYECTCVSSPDNMKLIGNLSIMANMADTGEPFVIVDSDEGVSVGTLDTSPTHTISISQEVGAEVVKIDQKYLPKPPVITHDTSAGTYSSELTAEELYEVLTNGKQVVYCSTDKTGYSYLISWAMHSSGRADLTFGGNINISLLSDGTIGATPTT